MTEKSKGILRVNRPLVIVLIYIDGPSTFYRRPPHKPFLSLFERLVGPLRSL